MSKVAQENPHTEKARGSDQGPLQLRMFPDSVTDDSQAMEHWALFLDEVLSVLFRLVHYLKDHQSKFGLLIPKQQLQQLNLTQLVEHLTKSEVRCSAWFW